MLISSAAAQIGLANHEAIAAAKAIVWLLDSENNWITGQTIAVDGGLSSVVPRTKV